MAAISLVTSLPLAMSRRDVEGHEVGAEYARACIASWRAAGFDPISVNSRDELARFDHSIAGVRMLAVDRDATSRAGRALVYFQDMLGAGLALGTTHVAITNADVLLEPRFDLAGLIAKVRPGEALAAQRVDIAAPDQRRGTLFERGYDFFAVHRDDLAKLEDFELIFGVPWWDHFLPTMLLLRGVTLIGSQDPFVYHLHHDERWKPELWRDTGWRYANRLLDLVAHGAGLDRRRAAEFAAELRAAMFGRASEPMFRLRHLLAEYLPARADVQHDAALLRVSEAGLRFVHAHHALRALG